MHAGASVTVTLLVSTVVTVTVLPAAAVVEVGRDGPELVGLAVSVTVIVSRSVSVKLETLVTVTVACVLDEDPVAVELAVNVLVETGQDGVMIRNVVVKDVTVLVAALGVLNMVFVTVIGGVLPGRVANVYVLVL